MSEIISLELLDIDFDVNTMMSSSVVIIDELNCSGNFLIIHYISSSIKNSNSRDNSRL